MVVLIRGILHILPSFLASALLIRMIKHRSRYRMRDAEKAWIESTEKFLYADGKYAWKMGQGPVVVLVHGWGGTAAQWYKMAGEIAKSGYTIIAPDITSHGESEGKFITFRDFWTDLRALSDFLGDKIYAYVGHSAGGLGFMTGRKLEGLQADRYVCIAAPSYPYPPVKVIEQKLRPPSRVVDRLKTYFSKQFGSSWEDIPKSSYSCDPSHNLLLVYDENDHYLYPGEVENIKQFSPFAESLITSDSGHEQLLRSEQCIARVCNFLEKKGQAA